jgi:hypothetical protein
MTPRSPASPSKTAKPNWSNGSRCATAPATRFSGLVNSVAPTGEQIETLKGIKLAKDPDGYDPEGLVALPDGSFWVSDEYGPFVTHFTAQGREISRLSPYKTGPEALPAELKNRVPNRGMEGLTITPDGHTRSG